MTKYKYNKSFYVKMIVWITIYLFLIVFSLVKMIISFSFWYIILLIIASYGLLVWVLFLLDRPALILDNDGFEPLPKRGIRKILSKKIFWKDIVKIKKHPRSLYHLRLSLNYTDVDGKKGLRFKYISLSDCYDKEKLLREFLQYCQHAEIDKRLLDKLE